MADECPPSGCSGCDVDGCGDRTESQSPFIEPNSVSSVKHIIGGGGLTSGGWQVSRNEYVAQR